jgi:hypothetical protein
MHLLEADLTSDVAHRILVVCQVLGDKEADRKALLAAGCPEVLKQFLEPSLDAEVCSLVDGNCRHDSSRRGTKGAKARQGAYIQRQWERDSSQQRRKQRVGEGKGERPLAGLNCIKAFVLIRQN